MPLARIRAALDVEHHAACGLLVAAQQHLVREQLQRIERARLAAREQLRGRALDLDHRVVAVLALADRERADLEPLDRALHELADLTERPAHGPDRRLVRDRRRRRSRTRAAATRGSSPLARLEAPALAPAALAVPPPAARPTAIAVAIATAASFATLAAAATAVALRALRRLAIARHRDHDRAAREAVDLSRRRTPARAAGRLRGRRTRAPSRARPPGSRRRTRAVPAWGRTRITPLRTSQRLSDSYGGRSRADARSRGHYSSSSRAPARRKRVRDHASSSPGIMISIMRACAGSICIGVIFCWTNIDAPISSGSTRTGKSTPGIVNSRSGAARSSIQPKNGAWRSWIELRSA